MAENGVDFQIIQSGKNAFPADPQTTGDDCEFQEVIRLQR